MKEVMSVSCVQLFETPWTVAYQPPLSMGFFRQEYWSGLPFPSLNSLSLDVCFSLISSNVLIPFMDHCLGLGKGLVNSMELDLVDKVPKEL